MKIFETPLSEVMDVLNGGPFVTGGYEIRPHESGYICTASTGGPDVIMLPHNATLIDATSALNVNKSGGM